MNARNLLKLAAVFVIACAFSGCSERRGPSDTKTLSPPPVSEPKPPTAKWRTRPKHKKPPGLPAEQVEAAERVAALLLEKKFEEALALCREFADSEPFQYLEVYARLLKAHAAGQQAQVVHPKTKRNFLEYFLSDDCPNEMILALLRDSSHGSLAYPLMEVLEQRAEDRVLDSTPQLETRMLEILEKNEPTRLRKATAHALQYWDWDTDKEIFLALNNALYAIRVMGYLRDPRFIEPLRKQYEIYRDEKERPLNLMTESLRMALMRLGVRDLDAARSEK
jgi:hypothetical protein